MSEADRQGGMALARAYDQAEQLVRELQFTAYADRIATTREAAEQEFKEHFIYRPATRTAPG